MYNEKEIIYIKALTPIHAGAGQGLNGVDMPIQREKHSNIPKIEGSSLKGSIKHWIYRKNKIDSAEDKVKKNFEKILGPEDGENFASRANFTDAKLLLFPIKSSEDVFKLVTCPYILKRWLEEYELVSGKISEGLNKIRNLNVGEGKYVSLKEKASKNILLEEYVFEKEDCDLTKEDLSKFLLDDYQLERIVIINDEEFIDLVTMYTEVITRNKINPITGTASNTGLFSEEFLPAETIMYFLVLGSPKFNEIDNIGVVNYINTNLNISMNSKNSVFQIGGDSTIGKGFVEVIGTSEEEVMI